MQAAQDRLQRGILCGGIIAVTAGKVTAVEQQASTRRTECQLGEGAVDRASSNPPPTTTSEVGIQTCGVGRPDPELGVRVGLPNQPDCSKPGREKWKTTDSHGREVYSGSFRRSRRAREKPTAPPVDSSKRPPWPKAS